MVVTYPSSWHKDAALSESRSTLTSMAVPEVCDSERIAILFTTLLHQAAQNICRQKEAGKKEFVHVFGAILGSDRLSDAFVTFSVFFARLLLRQGDSNKFLQNGPQEA